MLLRRGVRAGLRGSESSDNWVYVAAVLWWRAGRERGRYVFLGYADRSREVDQAGISGRRRK